MTATSTIACIISFNIALAASFTNCTKHQALAAERNFVHFTLAKCCKTMICQILIAKRCETCTFCPHRQSHSDSSSGYSLRFAQGSSASCVLIISALNVFLVITVSKPIVRAFFFVCPNRPPNPVTQKVSVHSTVCNSPVLKSYHIFFRIKSPCRRLRKYRMSK